MSLVDTSLKSAQMAAVQRMLAFNTETSSGPSSDFQLPPAGSSPNQWKILIFDAACRSVISPILSVQQLRKRGVTLNLLINTDREPIPDVPAIYFVRPTKENLVLIAQDCAKKLYASIHLNFVTKLDRSLMEEFAKLVVQSGSLPMIASVHDQYLDFCCMEKNLFTLHKAASYVMYNGPGATEQLMEQAMTEIAYGLFSVVATLGQAPVIRCPSGGAPEMVARKLCKMIAEHPTLLQQNKKTTGSRPLLVILDRNADLITPIQHCSTYQALIDDVLQHKANRVEFETITDKTAKRPKKIQKKYDLDPDEDPFYAAHKFQPFPEAIEENGSELQEVTNREQAIRSKTTIGGPDPLGGANDLVSAVDSLPALLERKKQLEVHTSILQAVMDEVAARDVPQFFELEYKLATGSYKNDTPKAKKDVLALISDAAKGSVSDKVRLILVFALATGAKPAALDDVCGALQQAATTDPAKVTSGIKAVNYIKQLRSMHMLPSATDMLQELQAPEADKKGSTLTSFMAKATTQATGLLAKATDRVSSMLGKAHKNHATVVVENLCDMKPGSEDETYLYLDPKVRGDVDLNKLHVMNRAPVREAIAFVVGGGCYSEYQNLQQMVVNERRKVCYGSTEIVDPETFVAQIGQLGSA